MPLLVLLSGHISQSVERGVSATEAKLVCPSLLETCLLWILFAKKAPTVWQGLARFGEQ